MGNIRMNREIICSCRALKKSPYVLWIVLIFAVVVIRFYMLFGTYNQIAVPLKPKELPNPGRSGALCQVAELPPEELPYIHFPLPRTFSREECACNPVRNFVLLSMQRSGSGWFETLLNSHPNISSNGEIFFVQYRQSNFSTIKSTLDSVYNLEWVSSATKNECLGAVGFKWMLNQAVMNYHRKIANYFNWKGVTVIFVLRRNLLRRLVSVLANAYDKEAKLINGTHKSHVHTREEADPLAQFKPTINFGLLIEDLTKAEQIMANSLEYFKTTRHVVLYYEDLLKNPKLLSDAQEFLRVPVRKLRSQQIKIHTKPLSEQISNWDDVYRTLKGSQYEHFLDDPDYIS